MYRMEKLSFLLSSTLESVGQLEAAAEELAMEAGLDEDTRFKVALAVREAAINAMMHGNQYHAEKRITASFERTDVALIFVIADEGNGFDFERLPDPLAPENILRGTGRGIFLIRSFMDQVNFSRLNPGTELKMTKDIVSTR
jgi:serine/threonine-protein kinase RsbW